MSLSIPVSTRTILEAIEANPEPSVDYELGDKLAGLHRAEGLTESERKGAWAESSAFSFRPMDESPWGTHYGPIFTTTKDDGTPVYGPDISEIDEEIIAHWERRAIAAEHPVLRAQYADIVWDLKKSVTGNQADVQYATSAVDAYLEAIGAKLYKEPLIHAVEAARRALQLALGINDQLRGQRCKEVLLGLFDEGLESGHIGVWTTVYDALVENKNVGLTIAERNRLTDGLEQILTACATLGDKHFDPWGAEAAAQRLATYYERLNRREDITRVIRTYGAAFERLAEQASPMLAMSWLQPIYNEFKNRGMHSDAARIQATSAEKGKNVASDLKEIRTPIEVGGQQLEEFVEAVTQGTAHEALLRIAARFIPKTEGIKALLQEMLTTAPLMARIGVSRVVGDHFAAQAGSIEKDPEGRLIMQLAQHIEIENLFLHEALQHLRKKSTIGVETILDVLNESPIFTAARRPLLYEGVQAYLEGDHIKAIHVIIPQVEQALRELLTLRCIPTLKAGRNGLMQLKNLNEMLREPAIKESLGEDLRLYL